MVPCSGILVLPLVQSYTRFDPRLGVSNDIFDCVGLCGSALLLTPPLSPLPDRVAQEQCCLAVMENASCNQGVAVAREQRACDMLFSGSICEPKTAKTCCHCCLLGRAAMEQGLSCDLDLSVAYQCGQVFQTCCLEGLPEGDANNTQGTLATGHTGALCTADPLFDIRLYLGGGQCSHHCLGNGTCACFTGYKLKPDGRNCEDINECLLGSHDCQLGERCINTAGAYRCQREISCGSGYELTDSNTCKDIDECETGAHNCGLEFVCQNTPGSFQCQPGRQCGPGFIEDALGSCIDINECLSHTGACPAGQLCINTVGSYICQRNSPSCGRGYHLNEEGTRCVDVDECLGTDGVCAGHGCVNTIGSFRCECRTGYIFNSISRTCEDINECRHYPGRLCAHKCENVEGSYQCSCAMGFKLATDGRSCDDVNECESNPCNQECANVYGSYQCYCRRGFQLSDIDGITCEDIDECSLPVGGHICSYHCNNTPGSFHCSCPPEGYTLASNGRSCQDLDECVTGVHNCSQTETCFNVLGGFRCLSFECPPSYRRTLLEPITCVKFCLPNDVSCLTDPVHSISHMVISLPTIRDFNRPEEIVFLRTAAPAHSAHWPNPHNIIFDIQGGNVQSSFDIVKRYERGAAVGVVRQVKPITGPLQTVLKVAMNHVTSGVISHRNIINLHIFVSKFWF
uniref:Fibulin-1 n=1 Tax=Scleropages formosus TaxID=113540 RepID=A0A8C9T7X7_SCLFO